MTEDSTLLNYTSRTTEVT